jgi:HAD superfamily hydrolase (TIGR01549 family)
MIKAVLFDYGGVLSPGGAAGSIRQSVSNVIGIAPNKIKAGPAIHGMFVGTATVQQFCDEVNHLNNPGVPLTVENFSAQADLYEKCEPVYALAEKLRTAGIKTGILSNVFQSTADRLKAEGYYEQFAPLILSYDVHVGKPHEEIYKIAVAQCGVPPDQIIFVDDKQEYLDPAAAMGMKTVLAKEGGQIARDTAAIVERENGITL